MNKKILLLLIMCLLLVGCGKESKKVTEKDKEDGAVITVIHKFVKSEYNERVQVEFETFNNHAINDTIIDNSGIEYKHCYKSSGYLTIADSRFYFTSLSYVKGVEVVMLQFECEGLNMYFDSTR